MAATGANGAEAALREDFARRIAALAEERAFAFRRLNLLTAITDSVTRADDEDMAAVYGLSHLRHRLGWSETEGVRDEVLERFAPVCRALHAASRPEPDPEADPGAELARFEAWYRERVGSSFWVLFENPMPETPLVDF
ncbi:hypothetical protein [Enterovirga aerilata]|uniref:Uncharacterized protein n=1 Tax=Enterovirga aerilata TaxID=2730920 RepID=A0A849I8P3_9HYPH|nr:hypothetical protein [Enterovirga sp. DB1703]NNM72440.1 hypothetical protein [Enterovirga sp. DB1703]